MNLEVFADLFNNVEDVAEIRKHDRGRINSDHIQFVVFPVEQHDTRDTRRVVGIDKLMG